MFLFVCLLDLFLNLIDFQPTRIYNQLACCGTMSTNECNLLHAFPRCLFCTFSNSLTLSLIFLSYLYILDVLSYYHALSAENVCSRLRFRFSTTFSQPFVFKANTKESMSAALPRSFQLET